MKKILIPTCTASLLLSACATPQVVKPLTSEDYKLSCEQISQELGAAEFAQKNAREDDRFRMSYVLVAPAIVSYFRMSEAETAAKDRAKGLDDIANRKGCQNTQANIMMPPQAQENTAAPTNLMAPQPPAVSRSPYPPAPTGYPPAATAYPPARAAYPPAGYQPQPAPSGFPPAPYPPR